MSNKKLMIGFKADPETKSKLEDIAQEQDRSISYIVNQIVERGLQEGWGQQRINENVNALKVLDYIDNLEFSSYGDFVRKTMAEGKYQWIKKDFGELQAYLIVCERLDHPVDPQMLESLNN